MLLMICAAKLKPLSLQAWHAHRLWIEARDTALALHDLGDFAGYRRGGRLAVRASQAYARLLREIAQLVQDELIMAECVNPITHREPEPSLEVDPGLRDCSFLQDA